MKQKEKETLLREASLAKINSYSPYSNFRVGSAVLLNDGKIIIGANIENANYVSGTCAENNCLTSAYAQGYRKDDIVALAISGDTKKFIVPCGNCRQVMSELLDENCPVFLLNKDNEVLETKVKKLLPYAFGGDSLND